MLSIGVILCNFYRLLSFFQPRGMKLDCLNLNTIFGDTFFTQNYEQNDQFKSILPITKNFKLLGDAN